MATPGRLIDLIDRNIIVLKNLVTLILDEADRMFDMGFKYDIMKIIENITKNENEF